MLLKAIKESGLQYTFYENGWYTENYANSIQGAIATEGILGSAKEGKFSLASRADYAEAAAVVLVETGHANKIYELGGDKSVTLSELADEISVVIGKKVVYLDLPEDEYKEKLISLGLPEAYASILSDSDVWAAKNALFDDSKELSKLIRRPTTELKETISAIINS